MTPREFINAIAPAAQESARRTGVPASVTIAQAALESAWGTSKLAAEAKNLFGIKASSGWSGDVVEMPTREFQGGEWMTISAAFRKYPDWFGSINDHAEFLLTNKRYKPAFEANSANAFADAIAAAGYATDPDYAQKLKDLIRTHGLGAYDVRQEEAIPVNPAAPWPFGHGEGETPPQEEKPMAPLIPLAIKALASAAALKLPELAQIVLDKDQTVPDRNVKLAAKGLEIITSAVGGTNEQDAVGKLDQPELVAQARAALRQQWFELQEVGGGVPGARDYDFKVMTHDGPWWQVFRSPSFWALLILTPLVYLIVLSLIGVVGTAEWTGEARAGIAGMITGTIIGGAVGYYWGQTTSRNRTPAGAASGT